MNWRRMRRKVVIVVRQWKFLFHRFYYCEGSFTKFTSMVNWRNKEEIAVSYKDMF